jgi:hypothetical protein
VRKIPTPIASARISTALRGYVKYRIGLAGVCTFSELSFVGSNVPD